MISLHLTDISNFLECRRKFFYNSILRITPKEFTTTPEYFVFGTHGHKILSAHYLKQEVQPLIDEIESDEMRSHLSTLYKLYAKQYANETTQTVSCETEHQIEFNGVQITFTIDRLLFDNGYQIQDHKFYSKLPANHALYLDWNFQASGYFWGLSRLGISANKFILNVIKKEPPGLPELLKSGALSKDKSKLGSTEYALYMEAINIYGLDPNDYKEILDILKARGSATFVRYETRRSQRQIDTFELDLQRITTNIKRLKSRNAYITPNSNCPTCPFHHVCSVRNNGGDEATTIKAMYRKKEDHER